MTIHETQLVIQLVGFPHLTENCQIGVIAGTLKTGEVQLVN